MFVSRIVVIAAFVKELNLFPKVLRSHARNRSEHKSDFAVPRTGSRLSISRSVGEPETYVDRNVQGFAFHDAAKLRLWLTELVVKTSERAFDWSGNDCPEGRYP